MLLGLSKPYLPYPTLYQPLIQPYLYTLHQKSLPYPRPDSLFFVFFFADEWKSCEDYRVNLGFARVVSI